MSEYFLIILLLKLIDGNILILYSYWFETLNKLYCTKNEYNPTDKFLNVNIPLFLLIVTLSSKLEQLKYPSFVETIAPFDLIIELFSEMNHPRKL